MSYFVDRSRLVCVLVFTFVQFCNNFISGAHFKLSGVKQMFDEDEIYESHADVIEQLSDDLQTAAWIAEHELMQKPSNYAVICLQKNADQARDLIELFESRSKSLNYNYTENDFTIGIIDRKICEMFAQHIPVIRTAVLDVPPEDTFKLIFIDDFGASVFYRPTKIMVSH